MPPRKKAATQLPDSPASDASPGAKRAPAPAAARRTARRVVPDSEDEEEDGEAEATPIKPSSRGKAKARPSPAPEAEEGRRRSGRLSGRGAEATPPPPSARVHKARVSAKTGKVVTPEPDQAEEEEEEEEEEDSDDLGGIDEATAVAPAAAEEEEEEESGDEEDALAPPLADDGTMQEDENEKEEEQDTLKHEAPSAPLSADHPLPSAASRLPPPQPEPPKGPQKRLIIHKMVLENFKSYAHRQEIGPFHKSFSAIVGPNGSGKSNTIDALLFVFGYRAAKMRQGKLSELIHNSEQAPDLGYCKVEVWFKEIIDLPGPDAFKTVPDSSLIVARTAYRDNKSKYTINDRTSTYTEVTTLLKDRGIDLTHKRFLILQGEVESIAQMKPKAATEHEEGLLEYLEDIIGTSAYKAPIEEALVEVDTLNEVMGEKKGRLGIVVRELNALKSKKKEAEDYLRDQNELARRQSALYQFHLYRLRNNLAILHAEIERFSAELVHEEEANKGNLAEIEALQLGFDQQNEIYQDIKRKTETIMKELAVQEKKAVQLEEKKKAAVLAQKKLTKALAEDGHAKSSASTWVKNHEETIERTKSELEVLERRLEKEEDEFEEIRDGLKDKTAEFSNQIEVKQRELEPWTAKISEKQAGLDVAASERDLLAKKASGVREAIEEAEQALQALLEGGQDKGKTSRALKTEKKELEAQLVSAEKKLASLGNKDEELRSKASATRQKSDEAKASLAAGKDEDAILSGLKRLAEMGRLDGFHGRLGDLGTIDDKYDVAVTTACGGSLNSLVTDTVAQGQSVIEHLRRTGGRANIFVLDKLPVRDLTPLQTPEGVPRLFDLIKPKDQRYAQAFFKATGQTIVAESLEQANRIAYGKRRWKVVTLGGDLIETSGAMSGGGTRVQRGGMSSRLKADRVEPQVIARYEKESEEAQQELATFQASRKTVEREIADLQKRVPEVEVAVTKLELDVKNGQKRVAEAERRVAELKTQNKPNADDEKRIAALEQDIAALEAEIEKLRRKSGPIEESIKSLQNQILEVGGVRLRSQKSRVDTTKQQIELASNKITKAEVDQTKARKDAEKAERAIAANTAKLEDAERSIEVLNAEFKACQEGLDLVRETLETANEGKEDLEEDLEARKSELDEKTQAINSFRARELELRQKIDEDKRIQKEDQRKHQHWEEKLGELELQYIEEDDEEPVPPPAREAAEPQLDDEGNPIPQPPAEDAPAPPKASTRSPLEFETFSDDELEEMSRDVLLADVANLEERVSKSKPNMAVLAEYRKRQTEFDDRQADLDAVTANRDAGKKRYDDLRQTRHFEFMAGFSAISSKLKEMYQLITLGGLAELELVDSLDPFSEGIIFSVMPPKKSWKNISNLSGGEKTLSSLALVFALHVFKPTPLYFMDEIDAALDFRNVSIIANYIRERTKSAQFIIISLRSDMFELSHRLVGIYKTQNQTKSVAIDNGALIVAQ